MVGRRQRVIVMTRVFIVGTGRCGTVSFHHACRHMTNYRTGHESRCGFLEYPDQWIEVSHHLRCVITHLRYKYPDALWVHLIREPEACIQSLAMQDGGKVMTAYETIYPSVMHSSRPIDIAFRYYWCENDNIRAQLGAIPQEQRREMHLETIKDEWGSFWYWIKAEGDFHSSLASWDVIRNATRHKRHRK